MAAHDGMTPQDVAARSGYSLKTVYRAIRSGRLRAYQPTSRYLITEADYWSWLHSGARAEDVPAREPSEPAAPGSAEALRAIEREAA